MAAVDPLANFSAFTEMVNRFRSSSASLEKTMEQLVVMKSGDGKAKELATEAALLVLDLKGTSRSIHLGVDGFRQHVQEYKKKLDASQQQLQNLLYRKQHLVRELTLCHDFSVREVEKVEKEEGLEIVTNSDDLASNEPHQKRLKLLTDELTSRSQLEEELKELTEKRRKLEESIDDNKTFLVGLPEQLRSIQGASQVLQRHFKLPGSEKRAQHDRAVHLSEPLYVLYRQLDSLCGVDSGMSLTIEDSEPFQHSKQKSNSGAQKNKSSKKIDTSEDKEDDLFTVEDHSILLSLNVEVGTRGEGSDILLVKLRFQRLVQFNTITVECESDMDNEVLTNLFPGDSGNNFPSHSFSDCSNKACLDTVYPEEAPARAYVWVQWLGGLNSLPESNSSHKLASSSRMVVQRLYTRIKAHSMLKHQLSVLSSCGGSKSNSSITVHPSCQALFPDAHKSNYPTLTKWSPLANNEETHVIFSSKSGDVSGPGIQFFTATFKTKKGTQEARVMITSSYPEVAPRWVLSELTSFDQDLKDIEVELNAHYDELVNDNEQESWNWLLFHQITRLQMCLGSIEELKSLTFHHQESRTRKGRNRRHPLAYSASEAQFFHR